MASIETEDSRSGHATPKIFWSWQSDYSERTCRHFIRNALVEAIAQVVAESSLEDAERPEIDHDTKGERGMADIAVTILKKIASAAVFVADLTPIARSPKDKWLPNPNVMIELGWAMHRPGWERVIGVLNIASGAQVEDLPFDIRQRRIITFTLREDATKEERKRVFADLVKDLKGALEVNLDARAEQVALDTEIKRIPSKSGNPSIWESAGATLTHNDAFGGARRDTVTIPDVPRAYIRIVPAGWRNGPPTVADIARLPQELQVDAPSDTAREGNFGATEDGFVRYWITGNLDDAMRTSANMVMFFEETGEFWMLHGSVIEKIQDQLLLKDHLMLGAWSRVLRSAMRVLDHFKARDARYVEAGLFGVKELHWYSAWTSERTVARRNATCEWRQSREWTDRAQLTYLTSAYNRIRALFALPRSTEADAIEVIARVDPGRFPPPQ
jgi:hypothetical protein